MSTLVHQRVEAARAGRNPKVICQVPVGWIVLGDSQFLPGYSLLLADPVVSDLNVLDQTQRVRFLSTMVLLGDALLEVTGACRINYEILGNTDAALHAHVFPRYLTEPEDRRKNPVFLYPKELRDSVPFNAERDRDLIRRLTTAILRRLGEVSPTGGAAAVE